VGFLSPTGNSESVPETHVALHAYIAGLPTLTAIFVPKCSRLNVIKISSYRCILNTKFNIMFDFFLLLHTPAVHFASVCFTSQNVAFFFVLPHYSSPLPITFNFFTFQRSALPPSAYHAVTSDKILLQLSSLAIHNCRPSKYETTKTLHKAVEVFMNIYLKCPRFESRLGHRLS
jgi:hypothetical protein